MDPSEMRYLEVEDSPVAITVAGGRSIPTAISAGSALAFTSAMLDIGGRTARVDNGKECFPYTTEKRSTAD
ncbi:unnamed protein product [Musa acuminata subsp. malaccensis]|uniref:(wild Malaysian banana) hypothetical protein n=1 Tax=Musa acuminata subsp. malaccensis TaxID=214687 RepID=A0A8D7A3K6_MUSAM|nr:unnamed protein product [Musa acuminata subsp. malaccensis]